jgi:hypothetical protein
MTRRGRSVVAIDVDYLFFISIFSGTVFDFIFFFFFFFFFFGRINVNLFVFM